MSKQAPPLYAFGPFVLDAKDRVLRRDRQRVPLTPKALETLFALVEANGRVVSKDELMRRLWPDTFVEEANLSHHVYKIRDALGEQPGGGPYVETLSKRGYQFVAAVTLMTSDTVLVLESAVPAVASPEIPAAETVSRSVPARATPAWHPFVPGILIVIAAVGFLWFISQSSRGGTDQAIRSVAVLPFTPLSSLAQDEPLQLGMANAIIMRLSRVPEVVVRPTSAVVKYSGATRDPVAAGREQLVDAVLDGQIQRSGDRVRVTVQLIRTSDGRAVWGETFDGPAQDVFAIQDGISARVTQALQVTLNADVRGRLRWLETGNLAAYDAYLKGTYHAATFATGGFEKAIAYFQEAIRLEPNFGSAHAGLAFAYAESAFVSPNPLEAMDKARAEANRALAIDDRLPDVHLALINLKLYHDWDWAGVDEECRRLIALVPGDARAYQWHGWALSLTGHIDEGLAELMRAKSLDPLSSTISGAIVSNRMWARRYDDALAEVRRLLETDPSAAFARQSLGEIYLLQGKYAAGIQELEASVLPPIIQLGALGRAYALAGRPGDARRQAATLRSMTSAGFSPAYELATVSVGLGDYREALKQLTQAFEERSAWMAWLKVDPAFDPMRSDPGFVALLHRIGFPESQP